MRYQESPSGLILIYEPPKQPTQAELMAAYHKLHCCCPQCGKSNYSQTCIGHILSPNDEYKDMNAATCHSCGWRGIVHDLPPEHPGLRYLLFDGIVHPVLPNETEAEIARRLALCNAREQVAYEIWPCDKQGNKLGTVPFKIWVERVATWINPREMAGD